MSFDTFYTATPFESEHFDGFAIVATGAVLAPGRLYESIKAAMDDLDWLRGIAPSPAAQQKYRNSLGWLGRIRDQWLTAERFQAQNQ